MLLAQKSPGAEFQNFLQYASGEKPPKFNPRPKVGLHRQDNWKTAHSFMTRVGINMWGIEPAGTVLVGVLLVPSTIAIRKPLRKGQSLSKLGPFPIVVIQLSTSEQGTATWWAVLASVSFIQRFHRMHEGELLAIHDRMDTLATLLHAR